jgi:hypothetical protein
MERIPNWEEYFKKEDKENWLLRLINDDTILYVCPQCKQFARVHFGCGKCSYCCTCYYPLNITDSKNKEITKRHN